MTDLHWNLVSNLEPSVPEAETLKLGHRDLVQLWKELSICTVEPRESEPIGADLCSDSGKFGKILLCENFRSQSIHLDCRRTPQRSIRTKSCFSLHI
ncbi:hypothetical protein AVEN_27991-1 [Araneus ventricosus]|uniref:Uncharacterized protein n=1 Tax=Araneus ventricosus TaxID=182803 RepID=A0A4Y2BIA2_ARAVE|nr:hypothetical protein AVEN_27991-1 [Araneus ventricosus]